MALVDGGVDLLPPPPPGPPADYYSEEEEEETEEAEGPSGASGSSGEDPGGEGDSEEESFDDGLLLPPPPPLPMSAPPPPNLPPPAAPYADAEEGEAEDDEDFDDDVFDLPPPPSQPPAAMDAAAAADDDDGSPPLVTRNTTAGSAKPTRRRRRSSVMDLVGQFRRGSLEQLKKARQLEKDKRKQKAEELSHIAPSVSPTAFEGHVSPRSKTPPGERHRRRTIRNTPVDDVNGADDDNGNNTVSPRSRSRRQSFVPALTPDKAWARLTDPTSGRPYWYNSATKESRWTDPAAEAAPAQTSTSSSSSSVSSSPAATATTAGRWTRKHDPASGHYFYHNDSTGESSWAKPAGFDDQHHHHHQHKQHPHAAGASSSSASASAGTTTPALQRQVASLTRALEQEKREHAATAQQLADARARHRQELADAQERAAGRAERAALEREREWAETHVPMSEHRAMLAEEAERLTSLLNLISNKNDRLDQELRNAQAARATERDALRARIAELEGTVDAQLRAQRARNARAGGGAADTAEGLTDAEVAVRQAAIRERETQALLDKAARLEAERDALSAECDDLNLAVRAMENDNERVSQRLSESEDARVAALASVAALTPKPPTEEELAMAEADAQAKASTTRRKDAQMGRLLSCVEFFAARVAPTLRGVYEDAAALVGDLERAVPRASEAAGAVSTAGERMDNINQRQQPHQNGGLLVGDVPPEGNWAAGQRFRGQSSRDSGGRDDDSSRGAGQQSFALMKDIVQHQLQEQEARHRDEVDELERTSKMALQSMAQGWADARAQLAEQSRQSWDEQSNRHASRPTVPVDGVLQLSGTRSTRSTRSARSIRSTRSTRTRGNGARDSRGMYSAARPAELPLPEPQDIALAGGVYPTPSSPNSMASALGGDGASGPQVRQFPQAFVIVVTY